jgi:hypothetical protein
MPIQKKYDYESIYKEIKAGSSGEDICKKFGLKKPTLKNIHYTLMTEKGEFIPLIFDRSRARKPVSDIVKFNKQGIRITPRLLKTLDIEIEGSWKVEVKGGDIVLTKV